MDYPLIQKSGQMPVHFMQGYTDYLSGKLNIKLSLSVKKPYLYISDLEKSWINQVEEVFNYKGKFWLVCSGTKNDYTVKGWGHHNYQEIIDKLYGEIQFVQVGSEEHNHKILSKTLNLIGKTDLRQLIRLCWHAQGGIGGVSLNHHIFAALEKPYVCIASGMEPVYWEKYETETYLCKGNNLPCGIGGCWKTKVVPLNQNDTNLCTLPIYGEEAIPKCMHMISPNEVIRAIKDYYKGGRLSY
jgi:ADP-heptose:LPS heptosyltransferase